MRNDPLWAYRMELDARRAKEAAETAEAKAISEKWKKDNTVLVTNVNDPISKAPAWSVCADPQCRALKRCLCSPPPCVCK